MADFSQSPQDLLLDNQQKGYVGIHIEQGVPVLDRDLNLLHDLVTAGIRALFTRYVGNGVAAGTDGFGIEALPTGSNTQDFQITAPASGSGSILVGGLEVTIDATVDYASQAGVAPLTTPQPTQPDPRQDTVYLDVFLVEVDGTTDPDLNNSPDVGVETSVRLKPAWLVQVAEGVPVPPPPDGHAFCPLAGLSRPRGVDTIDQTMLTDLRQRRLTVSDLEQRLSLMEQVLLLPAFVVPSPSQSQFSPKSGVIGEAITLNGSNLNVGSPQVQFENLAAVIVGTPSSNQLVAQVPAGLTPGGTAVAVHITVSNAGGSVISDELFLVRPAPAFAAPGSQFTPVHGTAGTQVTLAGFNFNVGTPQVLFGTVAASIVGSPTNTSLTVQVPTGVVPSGQLHADVNITVTTSQGSVVSDDVFRAEVATPAPAFSQPPQFTPKGAARGQNITLNGTNFNFPPVTVQFTTIGAGSVTVSAAIVGSPSATAIAVTVPSTLPSSGQGNITVTTAGGSVTSTDVFLITG